MAEIDLLIHRYLEDRSSLSPDELDQFIAALRVDPDLAAMLRGQLLLDDLLAQKLTTDRRNFVAQVEQRIADLDRGQEAIGRQFADLSSMAAAERVARSQEQGVRGQGSAVGGLRLRLRRWAGLFVAAALLCAVGAAVYWLHHAPPHELTVATVLAVGGEVRIGDRDESRPAEVDSAIERGEAVVVPAGGLLTLRVGAPAGIQARIQLKGDSEIVVGDEAPGQPRTIRMLHGEMVVSMKPLLAEKLRFVTPHSTSTTSAGQLRLVVTGESTLLDVSEGQVQFDRLSDKRSILVAANESGFASRDTLQIRQVMWPDRRDGLAYLLSPLEKDEDGKAPLVVARNPETRHLQLAALEPRGDAALLESRFFAELNGGYLISQDAGPNIFQTSRHSSELTLEAIFCPADLNQSGPARIVALGGDESDAPDFALAQDGCEVTFSLRTDAAPAQPAPPRVTMSTADTPLHLTVTYRNGDLTVYRDGMEIARSKDLWGSLAAWRSGPLTIGADAGGDHPWRGILEAFALYNRCLEPGEVARNARNYRLLAGRGM
jgi:hypothetical protein